MHDSNGSNSTAAAAVLCASQHVDFAQVKTLVLAATGAVGQVVCELVAKAGGSVVVASRKLDRARRCCESLCEKGIAPSLLTPIAMEDSIELVGVLSEH